MLIDYRTQLSPEQRKHLDEITQVLKAIEPQVEQLLANHRSQSRRWYSHEILPWGDGKDFAKIPWKPDQCKIRPDIVMALETNLLTEDNLPYYHAQIERMVEPGSVWQDWNRLWTAEEGGHAAALRDYMYLMRVMDPKEIEDGRRAIMECGFDRDFGDPLEVFAYTSAQELATRVSHQRAGQKADEPIVLKLLGLISRDENFHYIFYRSVVKAILELLPEQMLTAIMKQLYSFSMPGLGMNNFEMRQAMIENAGIYGVREHRDQVINPLLGYWELDKITGLSPVAEKVRDRILKLNSVLSRMVDRQERRVKKTD